MNDHADTVRVLRQMREDYGPGLLDYDEKCALDAAIAALEAGRSGEAGCYVHESALRLLAEGQEAVATSIYRETLGGRVHLVPQQPPPVGVTDAMVKRAAMALVVAEAYPNLPPYYWQGLLEKDRAKYEGWALAALTATLSHQQPAPGECCNSFPCKHSTADNGACPVSEPAASEEGLSLADRIGFMVADGRHMGINERTIDLDVLEEAARRLTTTGQGDVERLVEDDEDEDCPHCVNGIVPMTMNRPCSHCTPILHTSPLGQQQEGQG